MSFPCKRESPLAIASLSLLRRCGQAEIKTKIDSWIPAEVYPA